MVTFELEVVDGWERIDACCEGLKEEAEARWCVRPGPRLGVVVNVVHDGGRGGCGGGGGGGLHGVC